MLYEVITKCIGVITTLKGLVALNLKRNPGICKLPDQKSAQKDSCNQSGNQKPCARNSYFFAFTLHRFATIVPIRPITAITAAQESASILLFAKYRSSFSPKEKIHGNSVSRP